MNLKIIDFARAAVTALRCLSLPADTCSGNQRTATKTAGSSTVSSLFGRPTCLQRVSLIH